MEFHRWTTERDAIRSHGYRDEQQIKQMLLEYTRSGREPEIRQARADRILVEQAWMEAGRPFYNLWPKIVAPLATIKLRGLTLSRIPRPPVNPLLLRFAIGDPLVQGDKMAKCVLVNFRDGARLDLLTDVSLSTGAHKSVAYLFDATDSQDADVEDILGSIYPDAFTDDAVAQEVVNLFEGSAMRRIVIATLLLAADPTCEYLRPIVLNADREKWERTKDPALLERAKRRGNFGWDLGREIHTNPHWRRPHAALYHVGKGRVDTRVVFRKGALVKREQVTTMPTGYQEDE